MAAHPLEQILKAIDGYKTTIGAFTAIIIGVVFTLVYGPAEGKECILLGLLGLGIRDGIRKVEVRRKK